MSIAFTSSPIAFALESIGLPTACSATLTPGRGLTAELGGQEVVSGFAATLLCARPATADAKVAAR